MPAPQMRVEVERLAERRAALKRAGAEFPKRLQKLNKGAATRVAGSAQGRYGGFYERRTGGHERGIRAKATQAKAQVTLNAGGNAGGLMGQEFGSDKYAQFPARNGREGLFFYPAVRDEVPILAGEYEGMIGELMREAGLDG